MATSALGSPAISQQYLSPSSYNNQSFDHLSSSKKESYISLTTVEGDIVTLTSSAASSLAVSGEQFTSPNASGMTFSAASLNQEELTFSVQGDLNEEELADIAALYDDLTEIAADFYNGDLASAMSGALNIGDMGTVTKLSATFSYQEVAASRLTSHHVIPSQTEELTQGFADLPAILPVKDEIDPKDLLNAQWQQIKDFLATRPNQSAKNEEQVTPHKANDAKEPAATKMLAQLNDTISRHPRISPFALPLAHHAIEQTGNTLPEQQKTNYQQVLKGDLLTKLEDWLNIS